MGLLQAIALEALSFYFPSLDLDHLRLTLRRGTLHLDHLDLTPGHILLLASLPFRLSSGTIRNLSLHVPWTSLYSTPVDLHAQGIELHFSEIPFPQRQSQVFDAFANERRRKKNRFLAEAERVEAPITKLLQKFVPLLLHRVEASVDDIVLYLHFAGSSEGNYVCIRLRTFTITSKAVGGKGKARRNAGGDLAKLVIANGIEVIIVEGGETIVEMLHGGFRIELAITDGVYEFDMLVREAIGLRLDLRLGEVAKVMRARGKTWSDAFTYGRPVVEVARDVHAWFRYAVAAVMVRPRQWAGRITIEKYREAMAACIEYRKLHVKRLRSEGLGWRGRKRILELEDVLDAEMILLLRMRARADVMADEVSAFATKDWLSWALFGHKMSDEREHLASEVRKALVAAEQTDGEEDEGANDSIARSEIADTVSRGWSKAKLLLSVDCVSVQLECRKEELATVSTRMLTARAEVDASLQSYSVVLGLWEFVVTDGGRNLFGQDGRFSSDEELPKGFFEGSLRKLAFDSVINLTMRFAPTSAVLDADRIGKYVKAACFIRDLPEFGTSAGSDATSVGSESAVLREPRLESKISRPIPELVVSADISELRVSLWKECAIPDCSKGFSGLVFRFGQIHIIIRNALHSSQIKISCSVGLTAGFARKSDLDNLLMVDERGGMEGPGQNRHALRIGTKLTFDTTGSRKSANVKFTDAHVTISALFFLLDMFSAHASELVSGLRNPKARISPPSADNRSAFKSEEHTFADLYIDVEALRLNLYRDESESSSTTILLVERLQAVVNDGSLSSIETGKISLTERKYGGRLHVCPLPNFDYCLRLEICQSGSQPASGFLNFTGAHLSVVANPESVGEIVSVALQFARCIGNAMRNHVQISSTMSKTGDTAALENQTQFFQVSFVLHAIKLEPVYQESRILVRSQTSHFVFGHSEFSGSVNGLELIDESGPSGYHMAAIEPVRQVEKFPMDQRTLSFNVAQNFTSIHLDSLRITAFRPFIDRLSGIVMKFVDSIQKMALSDIRNNDGPATDEKNSSTFVQGVVCIQGSDISVKFPRSSHESDAISMEASQLTMTIRPVSLAFSIRKLSILTKIAKSAVVYVSPASLPEAQIEPEWAVLVRGLDLDVSYYSKDADLQSRRIQRVRSEWNVLLLSRAVVFISPRQVRLLKAPPNVFQSSLSKSKDCQTDDKPAHGASASACASSQTLMSSTYDHATLKVETQSISLELINEDHNGAVVSAIACLEINPIRFARKSLHERLGSDENVMVTRWTMECDRLQLEDRSSQVPTRVREIIKHGDDSRIYFPQAAGKRPRKKPSICIECVVRADRNGLAKSSYDVTLQNLHIVSSPHLLSRLICFFRQCSPPAEQEMGVSNSDVLYARVRSSERPTKTLQSTSSPERSTNTPNQSIGDSPDPLQKVSISLCDSFFQVFGRGRRVGESFIMIHAGLVKAVFLADQDGKLLPGSQVRLREIAVSIIWLPSTVVRAERACDIPFHNPGAPENCSHMEPRQSDVESSSRILANAQAYSAWRHSLTVPRERFRWNVTRQEDESHNCKSIASVRSGIIRFPFRGSDRWVIAVPTLSIDTSIRSLVRFAFVASVAEFLPDFGSGGDGSTAHFREIQVAVNHIPMRLKTPCTSNNNARDSASMNYITLRVRAALNGLVGGNPLTMSGSVKLAADVIGNNCSVREQVVAPCQLNFEVHRVDSLFVSLEGERFVRLFLSPLTIRALTSIVLNALPIAKNAERRPHREVYATDVDVLDTSDIRSLNISLSLRGVILCCVAEEPRVQLLRLVLRQIELTISIPLNSRGQGDFEFSLQDVFLEDTVSWRLYGSEVNEGENTRWASVVSGTEGTAGAALISRKPPRKLLLDTIKMLLIGDSNSTESSTERTEEQKSEKGESLSQSQPSPLCKCTASWRAPSDHISANLRLRGFELNLNMSIMPSLLEWADSVRAAALQVRDAHMRRYAASTSQTPSDSISTLQIGVDHVVIEPFEITVSTKAPPRRIQETVIRRSLMWLFGSEEVNGLTFHTPNVVFSGDFDSPDRLLRRLRSIYLASFTSARSTRQLLWQAPRIVKLARVAATSFLRNRSVLHSILTTGASKNHRIPHGFTHSHGLRDAIDAPPIGITTHTRATHDSRTIFARGGLHSRDEQLKFGEDAEKGIETVDITSLVDSSVVGSENSIGKSLFRRLRKNDSRVPKDERFELYSLFCADEALIVTSHYLLLVNPNTGALREPVIDRSLIMEYHVAGKRIAIVWARIAVTPVAKRAARNVRRDTSSMSSHVKSDVRISEILTHEIECYSLEYASWLHAQLPAPVAGLEDRIS